MPTDARILLDRLHALPDDERPTTKAFTAAYATLAVISYYPPSVVPTEPGGVQLEWHIGGVDIEIEFNEKGEQVFDEKEKADAE